MSITPASSSLLTVPKPVNSNANFVANLAKDKNSDDKSSDAPLTDTVTFTQVSEGRTDNFIDETSKLSDEPFKSSDSSVTTTPAPSPDTSTFIDTPPITDENDTSRMDHIRLGTTQDALSNIDISRLSDSRISDSDVDTSRLSEAKNFGQFVSAIKRFLSSLSGSQAKASDLLPMAFTGIDDGSSDSTTDPEASVTGHLDITG